MMGFSFGSRIGALKSGALAGVAGLSLGAVVLATTGAAEARGFGAGPFIRPGGFGGFHGGFGRGRFGGFRGGYGRFAGYRGYGGFGRGRFGYGGFGYRRFGYGLPLAVGVGLGYGLGYGGYGLGYGGYGGGYGYGDAGYGYGDPAYGYGAYGQGYGAGYDQGYGGYDQGYGTDGVVTPYAAGYRRVGYVPGYGYEFNGRRHGQYSCRPYAEKHTHLERRACR